MSTGAASSLPLTEDHELLRATVEQFARREVAPVIGELYVREEFPYALVARMGTMGLFGLPFPEEHGGMGGDHLALCLAIEELARVDSSLALTLEAAVGLGAMPIHRFGTEAQKRQWLPPLCRGEALGAFGLTEPGGGSDAGALRTRARRDGDSWVIDGTKVFITNAGTDITSLSRSPRSRGSPRGAAAKISAIVVPAGTPGMSVSKKYSKVGWLACDTRRPRSRLPGPARPPARGGGPGIRGVPRGPGRRAAWPSPRSPPVWPGLRRRVPRLPGRARGLRPRLGGRQALQSDLADIAARTHNRWPVQGRHPHGLRAADRETGGDRQVVDSAATVVTAPRGGPGLRRRRLHERDAGGALLPRRQDPGDRRGDRRSSA